MLGDEYYLYEFLSENRSSFLQHGLQGNKMTLLDSLAVVLKISKFYFTVSHRNTFQLYSGLSSFKLHQLFDLLYLWQ